MANERTSDEAVRSKTGKTGPEWYEILDKAGARELDHKGIVSYLTKHHGVGLWWCQMVTVTYEQPPCFRRRPSAYLVPICSMRTALSSRTS
jgi:hypothetical protein